MSWYTQLPEPLRELVSGLALFLGFVMTKYVTDRKKKLDEPEKSTHHIDASPKSGSVDISTIHALVNALDEERKERKGDQNTSEMQRKSDRDQFQTFYNKLAARVADTEYRLTATQEALTSAQLTSELLERRNKILVEQVKQLHEQITETNRLRDEERTRLKQRITDLEQEVHTLKTELHELRGGTHGL